MGQTASSDGSLVGNIYLGVESAKSAAAGEMVVTSDPGPGSEYVWVESLGVTSRPRRVSRDRILVPGKYRFMGRVDAPVKGDGGRWLPAPVFDGPGFARWLRAWMAAEGLSVAVLAGRAGIAVGTLHALRRGSPTSTAARSGQSALHPAIETIAGVAHGLGLQFGYVASKAGFGSEDGDRMANFTADELRLLADLLDCDIDEIDEIVREFARPLPKETD